MPDFTTDHLRNIVLMSHSGAGKTILCEAMLHAAGVNSRMGTIADGTTTSDFEPEETRRQTSVQTSIMACPWKGTKINLIDTPGYADYRGEVVSGIRVADAAIIVVAGPSGVEVGTQQMWQFAAEKNLPRMVFVSKMDRENADFQRVMNSLSEAFGRTCIAVQIPIGSEASFSGFVNLLDPNSEVPSELQAEVDAAREQLMEAIAETDDDLTEKFLEGESLTQDEITQGLKRGIASGSIVPVFVGNSTTEIGTAELMDAIVDYMPSPADVESVMATRPGSDEEISLAC
ncbi:MAG: GTP-binding protein, partial [Chloroflexi bacterium]|nr:GTP-binding protein [Chloroflexota bacterium]